MMMLVVVVIVGGAAVSNRAECIGKDILLLTNSGKYLYLRLIGGDDDMVAGRYVSYGLLL